MDKIAIRTATPEDAGIIARIHVNAWRLAYRGIMPEERLAAQNVADRTARWREVLEHCELPCSIITLDEVPVGFAHVSPSRDPDRDPLLVGEVNRIYLEPACWRRGIGTQLMQHALRQLAGHGYAEADLWVLEDHAMARRFYEKLGFHTDGASKPTRRGDLTEIRYTRRLDGAGGRSHRECF